MNDTSSTLAPPGRVRLPDIDSSSWEHPADRAALRSLSAIPGFSEVMRKIVALLGERVDLVHAAGDKRLKFGVIQLHAVGVAFEVGHELAGFVEVDSDVIRHLTAT